MTDAQPLWRHTLPTAILLMAPFDLLASLAMDIYLPVVPSMPEHLGSSPAVIQLSLSLYLLGLGLGQAVFGPLSDRFGRRPVLLGGALAFALASGCLAVANDGWTFVALRMMQALGGAAALVATFATVRDVYGEREESTRIYGLFSSMLAFVPALGPMIGALVSEQLGWRSLFWLLAILTVAPLLHALARWKESRPAYAARVPSAGPILRSRNFQLYTLAFGTGMGAFFVYFSTAPRLLIGQAGLSELQFSLAFASTAVVMIVTSQLSRGLLREWGVAGAVHRGMGLLLASSLCYAVASGIGSPTIWAVVLPSWLMAIGIVLTVSVTANGALAEFADRAGLAVALYFAGQSIVVSVVGTAAIVMLGGETIWPLVACTAVLPVAVLIGLNRRKKG